MIGWRKKDAGLWVTHDEAWAALGGQQTDDFDGWWLCAIEDGERRYVEFFETLRDAKAWVSEEEARHAPPATSWLIEQDEVETGMGLHVRLRLVDREGHGHGEVIVDGPGRVRTFLRGDLTPDESDAVATLLMRAAHVARHEIGGE